MQKYLTEIFVMTCSFFYLVSKDFKTINTLEIIALNLILINVTLIIYKVIVNRKKK